MREDNLNPNDQMHDVRVTRRRYWYVWEIFLLGFILYWGSLMDHFGLISYVGGLRNDLLSLRAAFLLAGLLPVALACIIVLAIRMGISWPKHIHSRKRLRRLRLLVIVGVVTYLGSPFVAPMVPRYKTFTLGFKKHVEAKSEIGAIRAWLSTLDPNVCTDEMMGTWDSNWPETVDWPESITRFDPKYVWLSLDETGHPMIELFWGGTLAHWGLVVGGEEMEVPKTKERMGQEYGPPGEEYIVYDTGEYRLPLGPGAYVWHEIQ